MHRFGFYIFTALITFGIGSLTASIFYRDTADNIGTKKITPGTTDGPYYDFLAAPTPQPAAEPPQAMEESSKPPFCRDKRILPVWNLIRKDKEFRARGDEFQNPDCSDMFEVIRFDLNRDGSKEILLRGKITELCGGVGNCLFWIFGKTGGQYRKLLASSDYVDRTKMGEQITRKKTNGYYDILLRGHMNASDTSFAYYKFDGVKYEQRKCLYETPIAGTGDNPKWEFITCREYDKRHAY